MFTFDNYGNLSFIVPSSSFDHFCEPNLDTLYVEIILKNINGYLVKETTNIDTASFFYYLDYYTQTVFNLDSLGVEPNIEEKPREAIITRSITGDWGYSELFRRLGAKIYLNDYPNQLIEETLNGLCEVLFLPDRTDDPLPYTNSIHYQHSELRSTKDYTYENYNYSNLLLSVHDYGFVVDGSTYNYGYSLTNGLVFSGSFRGFYQDGAPQVWHLVPNSP